MSANSSSFLHHQEEHFFVSPQGNDRWSGRLAEPNHEGTDGPFASLVMARDQIRHLKKEALLSGPVIVWLRSGRYVLHEPLQFTEEDSGPVTYAAYPGEKPILDGGRKISKWRKEHKGSQTVWVADLPEVEAGEWYFRQLFVNGERRPRARLPKAGYYWMKHVPNINFENGLTQDLFQGSDTFQVEEGDIQKNWHNLADVDVVATHFWIEERMPVSSFDPETGYVKSSRKSIFVLKDDVAKRYAKYYLENIFEAMTEPGEWYLDRTKGRLYYLPLEGEEPESTAIYAPKLYQFMVMEGKPEEEKYVEYVTFRGITFEHSDWHQPAGGGERFGKPGIDFAAAPQAAFHVPGTIYMKGVRYCTLEDCTLQHIGFYGIELSQGCQANRLIGNTISDMGAGGIKLDGADAHGPVLLRTGNNRITDHHIYSGGRIFHSAVGILSVHSFGNTIAHNHIHDLFYTGISCGWVWGYADNISKNNRIEKNHIHDLGHGLLSDMGGIYILGVQPGTVIRGNLIHDIEKRNYGGWAIYPDEGSSHLLIENNICYHTSSQTFHQHYGRENIVRNNIFAFGQEGVASITRKEDHNSFTFERNILITKNQPLFVGKARGGVESGAFKSDLNLFWDVTESELYMGNGRSDQQANWIIYQSYSWDQWQEMGQDQHSLVADPLFKDIVHFDFTISAESPAISLGFKPIDLSDVGPRPIEKRVP